jgi:hypothetical protein
MTAKENQSGTYRKTAIIVGVLFIIGTVTGILSVIISGPILEDPNYLLLIAENQNQLISGAICVLIMGLSLTMVPVMMFPILKKKNHALALGSVVFRGALEGVIYIAMVISWLLLIVLSQVYVEAGASDSSQYQVLGTILQESDDLMNIVLQIVFSIGALMFYTMFYQSKLIPRWLSLWGLIGGIPYFAWGILALFGLDYGVLMVPLAVQEMVFAVWLIIKGFNSEAIAALSTK